MLTYFYRLLVFTTLLIFSSAGIAQADVLQIEDVFELESANSPQISPDGKTIVYVRQFADVMTDKYYSNLWLISFDGNDNRPLTTGHYRDSSPRWSPDGTRIIFVSNRDGSPQIYMRWMDSGQQAKLTNLRYAPAGLAWSPDGQQISYTAFVPSPTKSLINMPPAPKGAKWAAPAKEIDKMVYRFQWSGVFAKWLLTCICVAD